MDQQKETPAEASLGQIKAKEKKKLTFRFVTIIVGSGDKQETFTILEHLICYHSPFFNAAFNSEFEEGKTKSKKLEDVGKNLFAVFVDWLYMQKLDIEYSPEIPSAGESKFLIELWNLAGRFLIPRLQNDAMRQLMIPYSANEPAYLHNMENNLGLIKHSYGTDLESGQEPLRILSVKAMLYVFDCARDSDNKDEVAALEEVLVNHRAAHDFLLALLKAYKDTPVPSETFRGSKGLMVDEHNGAIQRW